MALVLSRSRVPIQTFLIYVSLVQFSSKIAVAAFSPFACGGLNLMSKLKMTSKAEIEVVRQPEVAFLKEKGVFDWAVWSCEACNFPWTYYETETCYLLQGLVTVTPRDGRKAVTFGKGDFVTFPAGLSCVWDVKEAVQKHYIFH